MNSVLINKMKLTPVSMDARRKLEFSSGDTVRVWVKVLEDAEKKKYRLQAFEGLVLAVKHGSSPGGTFTVRKVASGVGGEKNFPIYYSSQVFLFSVAARLKQKCPRLQLL